MHYNEASIDPKGTAMKPAMKPALTAGEKTGIRPVLKKLAVASLLLLAAGSAAAGVTVRYAQPENFADLPFAPWERERVLEELDEHFARLAATLPAGQDLKVDVLDLDLAGRIQPVFGGARQLRILNGGADWPHIHLRYTVESGGKVLSSGEEHLSNMMYLDRINRYSGGDPLRYEKQMLDEWFKEKIAPRQPG